MDGETVETVADFVFLGYKITADGDCSHEIKRCLLLGRKVMTNLDSIFKSRDITLPTKVCLVKAMVFPVVMYGCESWTIKKAEHRINAFELWCWRRLLRVPWPARRSKQSILKEISPVCSLEGLMLKLKLQYFGHLMRRWGAVAGKGFILRWRGSHVVFLKLRRDSRVTTRNSGCLLCWPCLGLWNLSNLLYWRNIYWNLNHGSWTLVVTLDTFCLGPNFHKMNMLSRLN